MRRWGCDGNRMVPCVRRNGVEKQLIGTEAEGFRWVRYEWPGMPVFEVPVGKPICRIT